MRDPRPGRMPAMGDYPSAGLLRSIIESARRRIVVVSPLRIVRESSSQITIGAEDDLLSIYGGVSTTAITGLGSDGTPGSGTVQPYRFNAAGKWVAVGQPIQILNTYVGSVTSGLQVKYGRVNGKLTLIGADCATSSTPTTPTAPTPTTPTGPTPTAPTPTAPTAPTPTAPTSPTTPTTPTPTTPTPTPTPTPTTPTTPTVPTKTPTELGGTGGDTEGPMAAPAPSADFAGAAPSFGPATPPAMTGGAMPDSIAFGLDGDPGFTSDPPAGATASDLGDPGGESFAGPLGGTGTGTGTGPGHPVPRSTIIGGGGGEIM